MSDLILRGIQWADIRINSMSHRYGCSRIKYFTLFPSFFSSIVFSIKDGIILSILVFRLQSLWLYLVLFYICIFYRDCKVSQHDE